MDMLMRKSKSYLRLQAGATHTKAHEFTLKLAKPEVVEIVKTISNVYRKVVLRRSLNI
jgi:hypothetical protein